MKRIAIFGGTFDPVHNGHVKMAETIIARNLADKVFFLPAKTPPHKLDKKITSEAIRLRMLEAVAGERIQICRHEIDKPEATSYSYKTMRELKALYPDKKLLFVIGMDSLRTIHFWREFTKFIQENEFIIFTRPGQKMPTIEELNENIQNIALCEKLLNALVELNQPISSTQVREAVQNGASLEGLIPQPVQEIIKSEQLYIM